MIFKLFEMNLKLRVVCRKWRQEEGKDKNIDRNVDFFFMDPCCNPGTQNRQLAANMFPKIINYFPNIPISGASGNTVIACLQVYFSAAATWLRLISGLLSAACQAVLPARMYKVF